MLLIRKEKGPEMRLVMGVDIWFKHWRSGEEKFHNMTIMVYGWCGVDQTSTSRTLTFQHPPNHSSVLQLEDHSFVLFFPHRQLVPYRQIKAWIWKLLLRKMLLLLAISTLKDRKVHKQSRSPQRKAHGRRKEMTQDMPRRQTTEKLSVHAHDQERPWIGKRFIAIIKSHEWYQ